MQGTPHAASSALLCPAARQELRNGVGKALAQVHHTAPKASKKFKVSSPSPCQSCAKSYKKRSRHAPKTVTVSDLWVALCLTAHRRGACYNLQLSSHPDFPSDAPIHQKDPMTFSRTLTIGACIASAMTLMACSSMKTPATADVAVSQAAVDNANRSDAVEFAPVEMQAARDKLARAKQALCATKKMCRCQCLPGAG